MNKQDVFAAAVCLLPVAFTQNPTDGRSGATDRERSSRLPGRSPLKGTARMNAFSIPSKVIAKHNFDSRRILVSNHDAACFHSGGSNSQVLISAAPWRRFGVLPICPEAFSVKAARQVDAI